VLLGTCGIVKVVKIIVDSKCTGCETCVNNFPASVYEIKDGKSVPVRVEDCILCRTCESQCPEGAIQVIEVEIEPAEVKLKKVEVTKRKTKKKTVPKPAKSKKKSSH
jgi:NAD-dependent dihydropyrimidine dehydrogenase PreA subunit